MCRGISFDRTASDWQEKTCRIWQGSSGLDSPLWPKVTKRRLGRTAVCKVTEEIVHEDSEVEEIVKILFQFSFVGLDLKGHLYVFDNFHVETLLSIQLLK